MKELTKVDPALLAKWESRGHTQNKVNKIVLGNKKLDVNGEKNPEYGKLFAVSYTEAGEEVREQVGIKRATFFLAKLRVQIKCTDTDKDGKPNYWAREVDRVDDYIEVMNQDNEKVAEGLYRDLKETYKLKYSDAAYVWYNGKIYRWVISGAHFESWFALKKTAFKGMPKTFRVTEIKEQSVGNGTVWFNSLSFEWAEEFPLEQAIKIAEEVDSGLKAYYENVKKLEEKKALEVVDESYDTDLPFDN